MSIDFDEYVDLVVTPSGRRYRASAVVDGQQIRLVGKGLIDFVPDIVDLLVTDKVAGVRLLTRAADGLHEAFEAVTEARQKIVEGLHERASAVSSVAKILSAAGFSQSDIARAAGVTQTALASFTGSGTGSVWGSAALGSVPASVDSEYLMMGAWAIGEDGFLVETAPVLVSTVHSRVRDEFFDVTGLVRDTRDEDKDLADGSSEDEGSLEGASDEDVTDSDGASDNGSAPADLGYFGD